MFNLKKKILILLIICFGLIIFNFYYRGNHSNIIKNHFEVILGDEKNDKTFLISSDGYDYYLNGYDIDSSYVLINESINVITEDDLLYAREKIKSNIFSYEKDGIYFKVYKLRTALYNYIIDPSWLVKYDYIDISEIKLKFNKFEVVKDLNLNSIEFDDKVNKERLEVIKLNINIKLDDTGNINNVNEFINNGYKIDYLISQIEKNYNLSLVSGNGKYTSNELRVYDVDNYKIGVEYGILDDYLIYYVYLINL